MSLWLPTLRRLGCWGTLVLGSGTSFHLILAAPGPTTTSRDGTIIKLKRIANKAHPNMFELVEIFKQEQSDTEVSIAQLDTGSQPPKSAKNSVDKDKKIGELKSRFSQD